MTDQPRDVDARAGNHEGAYPPTGGWTQIIPSKVSKELAPKSKEPAMIEHKWWVRWFCAAPMLVGVIVLLIAMVTR